MAIFLFEMSVTYAHCEKHLCHHLDFPCDVFLCNHLALCVRGNLGQNCWIQRRYLECALMRLMQSLGVELSSSESSEGCIGPVYENVMVFLGHGLALAFGEALWQRFPHSLIPDSGSCSASLSSSLSHIEFLSADGSVSL